MGSFNLGQSAEKAIKKKFPKLIFTDKANECESMSESLNLI